MSNDAAISRVKVGVGAVTFEIEGTEALVKEGMNYAKENILTESAGRAAEELPIQGEESPEKEMTEAPPVDSYHEAEVKVTWGLAWGVLWRNFLIVLGIYAIVALIMFLALGAKPFYLS